MSPSRLHERSARAAPSVSRDDVMIVGAGVVGVATAYALARRGANVTLIDAHAEAGRGTSYANGGQLSYAYTDAMASPALRRQLPSLLAGRNRAFSVRLRADPGYLRWALRFILNSTRASFERNTLAGLRLGLESQVAMHELLAAHQLDFCHAAPGKLHIYDEAQAFEAARRGVALKGAHGAHQAILTPDDAIGIEPALASRRETLVGAVYSPQEEVGDPYRFCQALSATLAASYGARLRFGSRVARINDGGRAGVTALLANGERIHAGQVVVCTGIETRPFLAGMGVSAPIYPVKGYSFTAPAGDLPPRTSITDVSRRLVFCRLGEEMRIAGVAQVGFADSRVDERVLQGLVASARQSLPQAAAFDGITSSWAGLRPTTPSSLPIISRCAQNIVLNVGHGMLGWTYAMGSAERAARLTLERTEHA